MRSYTAVFYILALLLISAAAVAQGYDGVVAPAPGSTQKAEDGGGYTGVIAPAKPAAPQKKEEAPGYEGLMPGKIERAPPVAATPEAGTAELPGKMTPIDRTPGQTPQYGEDPRKRKARTVKDLQDLAFIYSYDKDADNIPDDIASRYKLPASVTDFLKQPRTRVSGMLPIESTIKTSIDNALEGVRAKRQRREDVVANLKAMRDGLKAKGSVSDGVYKVMGMPESYVKEEREGVQKATQRIDAALRELGSL